MVKPVNQQSLHTLLREGQGHGAKQNLKNNEDASNISNVIESPVHFSVISDYVRREHEL